jgi:hypothetical protein
MLVAVTETLLLPLISDTRLNHHTLTMIGVRERLFVQSKRLPIRTPRGPARSLAGVAIGVG